MRFSKMSSTLLTALAIGFVGCEPAETDRIETVPPTATPDATTTGPVVTPMPPAQPNGAATAPGGFDSPAATPTPDPGLQPDPAFQPGPGVQPDADDAPADEPLLQPDDSDTGGAAFDDGAAAIIAMPAP